MLHTWVWAGGVQLTPVIITYVIANIVGRLLTENSNVSQHGIANTIHFSITIPTISPDMAYPDVLPFLGHLSKDPPCHATTDPWVLPLKIYNGTEIHRLKALCYVCKILCCSCRCYMFSKHV